MADRFRFGSIVTLLTRLYSIVCWLVDLLFAGFSLVCCCDGRSAAKVMELLIFVKGSIATRLLLSPFDADS